jgi:hypothetical protein
MANTRHDQERDFDYIPRTYEGGPAYPEKPTRKPLTSPQQNHRARRIEEEHGHAKEQPILEPTAAELNAMPAETKAEMADRFRQLREVAQGAGNAAVASALEQTTVVQPELPLQ